MSLDIYIDAAKFYSNSISNHLYSLKSKIVLLLLLNLANFRVLKIVPSPGKKASKSRYRETLIYRTKNI